MPTYEYLCKTCGHRFETWQKMSDEPLTVCPNCGAEIHRVLFATGVVFKGSGFYSTETRSQPSESSSSETPAASANGDSSAKDTSSRDTPAKSDSSSATPAASSSAASTDSGSKASASNVSGKDS